MNPDELIHLLASMEMAHRVAEAVRTPAVQAERHWDLARWKCEEVEEAVRFIHHDPKGRPDTAILCVNSPESCRWVYEMALRLAPYPTTLLILHPAAQTAAG